ncbi:MAG: hypothetical protein IJC45_11510, partial [Clostridia bacterium]|nr:hypothetical protein [Clostridia bacterium]
NGPLSNVFEINDNCMVLVDRNLNSVVVFDTEDMCVTAAYRVDGNIIGSRMTDLKTIEVIVDKKPYSRVFILNADNKEKKYKDPFFNAPI